MTYSFNSKYSFLLLSMALASGNSMAGTEPAFGHQISKDKIYAEMVAEVERDSQEFANFAENSQLRHRVNEQEGKGNASKIRAQKQHKTMNQHQYQWEKGNRSSQPIQGKGSMNRGGGGSGGGRR